MTISGLRRAGSLARQAGAAQRLLLLQLQSRPGANTVNRS